MDRQTTTDRTPSTSRGSGPVRPTMRNRSTEPHHRRRRASLLAGLVVLALIVGIAGGSGGSARRGVTSARSGFFEKLGALAGSGQGSFAAQQQTAENAAIDRTLALTPLVVRAGAQHREMALTFDDGPGPFTPEVLQVLERERVPATFFTVGTLQRYFHDSTTEMVSRGFAVEDHTQAHAPMSKLSLADQRTQIVEEISAAGLYGAPYPRLFRPPYGLFNQNTLSLLAQFHMLMVMWTVDTEDYRRPGSAAIVERVLTGARPGAIVLMHDAGGPRSETVAALPEIIRGLRMRGYTLVTVPRLLLDNPVTAPQSVASVPAGGG